MSTMIIMTIRISFRKKVITVAKAGLPQHFWIQFIGERIVVVANTSSNSNTAHHLHPSAHSPITTSNWHSSNENHTHFPKNFSNFFQFYENKKKTKKAYYTVEHIANQLKASTHNPHTHIK